MGEAWDIMGGKSATPFSIFSAINLANYLPIDIHKKYAIFVIFRICLSILHFINSDSYLHHLSATQ
jgi:hypothetical protein